MRLRTAIGTRNGVAPSVLSLLLTSALLIPTVLQHQSSAHEARVKATRELSESTGLQHDQLSVYPKIVKSRIDTEAKAAVDQGQALAAQDAAKADVSALNAAVASLKSYRSLDVDVERSRIANTTAQIQAVTDAAAAYDRQAAARAAAAAAAAAAAQAAANTPEGAQATAKALSASRYGWGDDQFQCLVNLWQKESGWSYTASNGSSGAGGIPQALPASKMASAGSDWASNATTQITWGLQYIASGYGTPCSAWSHSESSNWY